MRQERIRAHVGREEKPSAGSLARGVRLFTPLRGETKKPAKDRRVRAARARRRKSAVSVDVDPIHFFGKWNQSVARCQQRVVFALCKNPALVQHAAQ